MSAMDEPASVEHGGEQPQERAALALPGYHGRPVIKPPVWTWEVPVYFFVGGVAGMGGVIALAALLFTHPKSEIPASVVAGLVGEGADALRRASAWLACIGAAVSGGLLIRDLGRPHRFLYMLRVFKLRSPMSVGAWVLACFGAFASALALALQWPELVTAVGLPSTAAFGVQICLAMASAVFGTLLATYTGVLIGATVVPAWHSHHRTLPLHFGVAGLGSAAALLELLGFRLPALAAIGVAAAGIETCIGGWIELHRKGAADRALRSGVSGWLLRISGVLAGPASLLLRLGDATDYAAVSFVLGALLSRFGWIEAGRASARDPRSVLEAVA
jgi:hypothetical protein